MCNFNKHTLIIQFEPLLLVKWCFISHSCSWDFSELKRLLQGHLPAPLITVPTAFFLFFWISCVWYTEMFCCEFTKSQTLQEMRIVHRETSVASVPTGRDNFKKLVMWVIAVHTRFEKQKLQKILDQHDWHFRDVVVRLQNPFKSPPQADFGLANRKEPFSCSSDNHFAVFLFQILNFRRSESTVALATLNSKIWFSVENIVKCSLRILKWSV